MLNMESSDSSSDDDSRQFEVWNDWRPPDEEGSVNPVKETSKVLFSTDCNDEIFVSSMTNTEKFGNWIPTVDLYKERDLSPSKPRTSSGTKRLTLRRSGRFRVLDKTKLNSDDSPTVDSDQTPDKTVANVFNVKRYLDKTGIDPLSESKYFDNSVGDVLDESTDNKETFSLTSDEDRQVEKQLNLDWGKRIELHDVTNFTSGSKMWGVVRPGVFGSIKLWENEYGHICGSAQGKLSKEGTTEVSLILIGDTENLRKLLNLKRHQWSALLEMIQRNKTKLTFEALAEQKFEKMNSLEKLWYYTCKRRHFLPDQCMLVEFCGAVKSMQDFKIIPKLIVKEIRDIKGEEID